MEWHLSRNHKEADSVRWFVNSHQAGSAPAVIIGMAGLGAKAGYKLVSALQKYVKFAKEAVNYYDKIKLYGVKLWVKW